MWTKDSFAKVVPASEGAAASSLYGANRRGGRELPEAHVGRPRGASERSKRQSVAVVSEVSGFGQNVIREGLSGLFELVLLQFSLQRADGNPQPIRGVGSIPFALVQSLGDGQL